MKWEEWNKKDIRKVIDSFSMDLSTFQAPTGFRSRYKSNEKLFKKFNKKYPNLCSSLKEFYLFVQHMNEESFVELLFCPVCGKRLKILTLCSNKGWGVPHFCSRKCSAVSDSTKQKRVETVKENYGVENISQSEENKVKVSNFWKRALEDGTKERIVSNIIKTNKERYGVDFASQSEKVKEDYKKACLEKYGVDNPAKTPERRKEFSLNNPQKRESVRDKTIKTNIEKYGVKYVSQNEEVKKKYRNTMIERYGVEYPSQSEEIKQKCKETNLKRYGVECNFQVNEIKENIKRTNLERYGVENPMQSEILRDKQINSRIRNGNWTTSSKENEVYLLLKSYFKEVLTQYKCERYPYHCDFYIPEEDLFIEVNGWIHGSEPYDKNNPTHVQEGLRLLSHDEDSLMYSKAIRWIKLDTEKRTWVQKNKLNFIEIFLEGTHNLDWFKLNLFKRKKPIYEREKENTIKSIVRFIRRSSKDSIIENSFNNKYNFTCDIRLPSLKLAIVVYDPMLESFDGSSKENPTWIQEKADSLDKMGYSHLFISTWGWYFQKDIWKSVLLQHLGLSKRIFARKCQVKEVESTLASSFLEENHLQGKCQSSIRLGLFFNDELVSIMTFGKPRFSKECDWELIRFCNKLGYSIVGGASKLLAFFRKNNKGTLISYANRNWSKGNLYETLGFKKDSITAPGYGYVKEGEFKIFSRNKFQKKKLEKKLPLFSSQKSEVQNMYSNGYRRIFDSGHIKYILV